jgi:pyruvate/2-oxoacid:ferredoxin oxidoreductase beta subunit
LIPPTISLKTCSGIKSINAYTTCPNIDSLNKRDISVNKVRLFTKQEAVSYVFKQRELNNKNTNKKQNNPELNISNTNTKSNNTQNLSKDDMFRLLLKKTQK